MFKLDEKYLKCLIVKLYGNQIVEKYVQMACKSIINPLHECQRPALIKFVYEAKEKNSVSTINLSKYNFLNDDCIKVMISLQTLIKRLLIKNIDYNKATKNLLKYLFYLLVDTYESQVCNMDEINDKSDEDEHGCELIGIKNSVNLYLIGNNYIKRNFEECEISLDSLVRKLNRYKISTIITNVNLMHQKQQIPVLKLKTNLINFINSLKLIKLCTQYVEPSSKEFLILYSQILSGLNSFLKIYVINLTFDLNMLKYIIDLIKCN